MLTAFIIALGEAGIIFYLLNIQSKKKIKLNEPYLNYDRKLLLRQYLKYYQVFMKDQQKTGPKELAFIEKYKHEVNEMFTDTKLINLRFENKISNPNLLIDLSDYTDGNLNATEKKIIEMKNVIDSKLSELEMKYFKSMYE